MSWNIVLTNWVSKQLKKLPVDVVLVSQLLIKELEDKGPYLIDWPNYGKLHTRQNMDRYHCHLMKGNPTYVACWEILNKRDGLIEVYYVGTHEKAPY